MRVSPSTEIRRSEMDEQPRNKLTYISQIFKTTVGVGGMPTQMAGDVVVKRVAPPWPGAVLQIEGASNYARELAEKFETIHGIPQSYTKVIPKKAESFESDFLNQAKVSIEYFPKPPGTQTIGVHFSVRDAFNVVKESFNVEFELSPDKAYVTEVSAEINRLKMLLVQQAHGGRVKNIKIATKPIGIVSWEREVSTKAQADIKLKIKASLEGQITLPISGGTTVKIELYGSLFKKFQEDGVIKNGIEAGFVLTIPIPGLP